MNILQLLEENPLDKSKISALSPIEIASFFHENLAQSSFREINRLLEGKELFPNSLMEGIVQQAIEKLETAKVALMPPYGDFSKILYLKEGSFYTFLNHIKTRETEEKLQSVLESVIAMYQQDSGSELAGKTFIAIQNYKAFDDDLAKLIAKNKYSSEITSPSFFTKRNKQYIAFSVIVLLIGIKIIFFLNVMKPFRNFNISPDNSRYEYHDEPRKIDRYYTGMKFQIDSFFVFLTDYNPKEIRRLTAIDTIKTGQNPFETFYQSLPKGESNNFITIKNDTNCDMVLLENAMMYDTIKLPKAAYYIKQGKTVEVNKKETAVSSVFNVYLGKKLATFQTNSMHLFIRDNSVVEYRFSELIPSTKEILETDYSFVRNTSISLKNGILKIN